MQDHRIEGVGDVDAEDLLAQLDAENVHDVGRDEVGFSCFWIAGHAGGDQHPSAHVNRDSLLWRCKGCGRSGNLLELVKIALPHGTTHPEAMAWLREHFGEVVRAPRGGSLAADLEHRLARAHHSPPARILPNEAATIGPEGIFALDWRGDHEAAVYMRGRGFDPAVLEDWGVGYDHWTRRVAIPVRDADGILVGFKGRLIDDSHPAKYLLLGDTEERRPRYGSGYGFDMHDARVVLFGLDRARGHDRVALVEGELNVIAAHAAGVPAVAPGTTYITVEQLWLMRAHFDELVNLYDSDDAGENAVWGFADETGKWNPGQVEKLTPYFTLLVADEHPGDPADMVPEEVQRLFRTAQHWTRYLVPSAASV
jgi:DNA primase